jgi:septum formation protein
MDPIILASQSARRKQILEWAEIDFEVIVSNSDETFPEDLPIEQVPVHIARNKAISVKKLLNKARILLAADTVVVLGTQIIGKPLDRVDAIGILTRLSGQKHQVITGVVIIDGEKELSFTDTTEVWFHELSAEQIQYYVDKYQPYDKAGAYAIQEWIGVIGIKGIRGDFYNVMGLPVSRVLKALSGLGINT